MTLDWSRAAVLTTTEFEVCWEYLHLGETPWQLDPPRSGTTREEREAIIAGVFVDMQRRGLAHSGEPRPDIVDQMRMLARPEWSVDVRFRTDALVAGVAACVGRHCTLAVRHGREIAMIPLAADDAPGSLIELLGVTAPGRGHRMRLTAAALGTGAHDVESLVATGVPHGEATALMTAFRDIALHGQLGASAASGDGSRTRRAPYVIGFHHGSSGTFRSIHRGDIVTVEPTSRDGLLAELTELVSTIR